jgi:hypothetical protein
MFPFWWRDTVTTEQRFYQFLGDTIDEETIQAAQEELARLLELVKFSQTSVRRWIRTIPDLWVKDSRSRVGSSKVVSLNLKLDARTGI